MRNLNLVLLTMLLPFAAFAKPQIMAVFRNGIVGASFSQNLQATEAAEWSVVSGSLPPGISLLSTLSTDPNFGSSFSSLLNTLISISHGISSDMFSGTPKAAGTYNFTLRAENASGSDTKSFTVNVIMPNVPRIATSSLPNGKIGQSYSQSLKAVDYAEWSMISGNLPPGIKLNSNGSISGTPTAEGEYTFTVKAENATGSDTKSITINVTMPEVPQLPQVAPRITTTTISDCKIGLSCARAFLVTGSVTEWSITSGNLPPGMELNSGSIYGTPTSEGEYTFTVKAENAAGSDTKSFTINVIMPNVPQIATSSLPNGKVGQYCSQSLQATESSSWSIISGLPPGLEMNSSGYISGPFTAEGEYTFTVKAENAVGSDTKSVTINVTMPEPPEITTNSLTNVKIGQSYSQSLRATDLAYWSIESGRLPPGLGEDFGLSINNGTGSGLGYMTVLTPVISGTPIAVGEYTFTVRATNLSGSDAKTFTINVTMPEPPEITTSSLPDGKVGKFYSQSLKAADYAVWSIISGSLPEGIRINSGGTISGTPTEEGEYTFTVKAENVSGNDTRTFTINVTMPEPPEIATASLPDGKVGQDYEQSFEATDYAVWSIESGDLPPGIELDPSGSISGTPTEEGEYTFTVKAENITGSDTKTFTITVENNMTPIQLPKIAKGNIRIQATTNAILLSNLPANAKVEVYNLQGKRIYSAYPENPQILRILVQTKGIYLIKAGSQAIKVAVR